MVTTTSGRPARIGPACRRCLRLSSKAPPRCGCQPGIADALAQLAALGECEWRQGADEDDGVILGRESTQDVLRDGLGGQHQAVVSGALQQLSQHDCSQFVGLAGGVGADDGDLLLEGIWVWQETHLFGLVLAEAGQQLSDAKQGELPADIAEGALVAVFLGEAEDRDEDGIVERSE